jgi:hypothetical protein
MITLPWSGLTYVSLAREPVSEFQLMVNQDNMGVYIGGEQ